MPEFVIIGTIILSAILLLLFAPLRILVRLRTTVEGGLLRLNIRLLFFQMDLSFRLDFLSQPALSVTRIKHDGTMVKMPPPATELERLQTDASMILRAIDLQTMDVALCLGIEGYAAETALLAGAAESALRGALSLLPKEPFGRATVRVTPDFKRTILILDVECMIFTFPAKIIPVFIPIKKGGKQFAASN